jgi:hypothetical protein
VGQEWKALPSTRVRGLGGLKSRREKTSRIKQKANLLLSMRNKCVWKEKNLKITKILLAKRLMLIFYLFSFLKKKKLRKKERKREMHMILGGGSLVGSLLPKDKI